MSRVLLSQWHAGALRGDGVVERGDGDEQAIDRWLAGLRGAAAPLASAWTLRRWRGRLAAVLAQADALAALDEPALDARIAAVRDALRRQGLAEAPVCDAFALVREVSRRLLGKAHHPVQLLGGWVMLSGRLAEMATGEGKTLTALLPSVTVALAGAPVHVVTVNDYLAARDAEQAAPVLQRFGLDLGVVHEDQPQAERAAAWRRAVVYTTNKDLVFDYLRDQIADSGPGSLHPVVAALAGAAPGAAGVGGAPQRRLRGLYFVLIDEADSVLVDEARTPLILSAERDGSADQPAWTLALATAQALEAGLHWRLHARERQVELLPAGQAQVDALCRGKHPLLAARRARHGLVQQALSALHLYHRDQQYIVRDGKVQIVDENTGRVMADRSWEGGLHQMIELKEGVTLTQRRDTLARLTYQRFFRRYLRLAGMSGTVSEVAGELRAVYALDVVRVPTHRPVLRRHLGEKVFLRAADRWAAVARRAAQLAAQGRAVLIGTRSVGASEAVSQALQAAGLDHALLNARQDAEEAALIGQAGQPGRITVATNMAGRGTDILLHPQVREAGGLHVILTEFHESARVDRQLYGRAGRQGDPGSCEALVSLGDDVLVSFGAPLSGWLARSLGRRGGSTPATPQAGTADGPCLAGWAGGLLRRLAQWRAERHATAIRRRTVTQDRQLDRRLAFSGRPR